MAFIAYSSRRAPGVSPSEARSQQRAASRYAAARAELSLASDVALKIAGRTLAPAP